ncbi:hypothetical protein Mapa_000055 [Marchantia paleacea]|nr:hypothetical protein Mapa_000055 [Marchantia paleacea]
MAFIGHGILQLGHPWWGLPKGWKQNFAEVVRWSRSIIQTQTMMQHAPNCRQRPCRSKGPTRIDSGSKSAENNVVVGNRGYLVPVEVLGFPAQKCNCCCCGATCLRVNGRLR